MICPKCGLEIEDSLVCNACGWTKDSEEKVENQEKETEVDFAALENLSVEFEESVENIEEEAEFVTKEEDLVIDFDQINNQASLNTKKNSSFSWLVSLVSFVAGVLATLITIGCFNGTITGYLDRITIGTPYETVETLCKLYYQSGVSADEVVDVSSPYFRAQLINEMKYYEQYYGLDEEINLDIDISSDEEYEKVVQYHIDYFTAQSNQKIEIKDIKFSDLKYFKSGTDEFKTLFDYYKSSPNTTAAKADGVCMFASVSFEANLDVTSFEREEVVPETTSKKNKKSKNKQEITTQPTTSAPTTSVESVKVNGTAICVKINEKWCIFNGMPTE